MSEEKNKEINLNNKKDSFIFYRSFAEGLEGVDDSDKLAIIDAIIDKALNNKDKDLVGFQKNIFALIKPQLEANNKRFNDGSKGGRPKKNTGYEEINNINKDSFEEIEIIDNNKNNPSFENKKPNKNVNENVYVNPQQIKNSHFTKPTIEEVKSYCSIRKNTIQAERFIDFYDSKAWKVSNQPMKDWQACIRTWETDEKNKKQPPILNKPNWQKSEAEKIAEFNKLQVL